MKNNNLEQNNYVHIEPNSHFYTDVSQIIRTIEGMKQYHETNGYPPLTENLDYILIGLKNTKMNGYELKFNQNFNPDGYHHETGEKEL